MKHKPAPLPKPENTGIAPLPPELADAIDALPLLDMVDSVQILPKSEPDGYDPVAKMVWQAEHILEHLDVLSSLGKSDAVKALRDIGTNVAEKLARLGQPRKPDFPAYPAIGQKAPLRTVKLGGDFTTINGLLEEKIDVFISELPRPLPPLDQAHEPAPPYIVVDVVDALRWRKDLANKMCDVMRRKREDGMPTSRRDTYPPERLSCIADASEFQGLSSDSEVPSVTAEAVIHDRIRRRLEERLALLAPTAASRTFRQVASESPAWPIVLSAIEDKRRADQAARESLDLGGSLPFRIKRKPGAGSPRKFSEGSAASFAVSYMLELHAARESQKGLSKADRKWALERLSTIKSIYLPKIEDPNRSGSIVYGMRNNVFSQRWYLSAAFLPRFPTADETAKSDETLRLWIETAMYRAEWECLGFWDDYPRWPKCVTNRIRKGDKKRSAREVVREKLRSGLMSLSF